MPTAGIRWYVLAARLVEWSAFTDCLRFAASCVVLFRAEYRRAAAADPRSWYDPAEYAPAPAVVAAAVPAAAPAPEVAGLAAEQRLASATEEAMLEDLQRAEEAHYRAHQVSEPL